MNKGYQADAAVAKLLACLPGFGAWANRPLDPGIQKILNEADPQTVMSIAAYALRRIADDAVQNTPSKPN